MVKPISVNDLTISNWCENARFGAVSIFKTVLLPRKARDKHKETLKKRCVFRRQHGTPPANVSASLLALPRGTITYVYKIWDVSFEAVEELGAALKGTHVKLVDVRAMSELVRAKAAAAAV